MEINYAMLDPKIMKTIQIIEKKPHVKWIRYMLTKRYSPIEIKRELQRLGLSAPHEKPLKVYYLAVIDPLIKKHGLGYVYGDYKSKILSEKNVRGTFAANILRYKLEFQDDLDGQIKFCKFLQELEIEQCWINELIKMYGVAANIPTDENGERIVKCSLYKRSIDKLLTHPKRYLVDKLILENVPALRICEYVNKNFDGLRLFDYDIKYYMSIFFNMRTFDIEEKIKLLSAERNNLATMLSTIDKDDDMELGEKTLVIAKTNERINELDENVRVLNSMYSESAINIMELEKADFEQMFLDIVSKSYKRFTKLDNHNDRDVVDPLMKVARMMGYAYEKAKEAKEHTSKNVDRDKHTQGELMNLYRARADEYYDEQDYVKLNKQATELLESSDDMEILGIEELNILHEEE